MQTDDIDTIIIIHAYLPNVRQIAFLHIRVLHKNGKSGCSSSDKLVILFEIVRVVGVIYSNGFTNMYPSKYIYT